jgi:glucose-1-phosphate adenylyltransferase
VVIENSVIGLRSQIGEDVTIRHSVLMGQDYYEPDDELASDRDAGRPPLGIGSGTTIENAIVDKNCHIGRDVGLRIAPGAAPNPRDGVTIEDGIVVVEKGAVLPDGWSL